MPVSEAKSAAFEPSGLRARDVSADDRDDKPDTTGDRPAADNQPSAAQQRPNRPEQKGGEKPDKPARCWRSAP